MLLPSDSCGETVSRLTRTCSRAKVLVRTAGTATYCGPSPASPSPASPPSALRSLPSPLSCATFRRCTGARVSVRAGLTVLDGAAQFRLSCGGALASVLSGRLAGGSRSWRFVFVFLAHAAPGCPQGGPRCPVCFGPDSDALLGAATCIPKEGIAVSRPSAPLLLQLLCV